jgi:hypothetical protein
MDKEKLIEEIKSFVFQAIKDGSVELSESDIDTIQRVIENSVNKMERENRMSEQDLVVVQATCSLFMNKLVGNLESMGNEIAIEQALKPCGWPIN